MADDAAWIRLILTQTLPAFLVWRILAFGLFVAMLVIAGRWKMLGRRNGLRWGVLYGALISSGIDALSTTLSFLWMSQVSSLMPDDRELDYELVGTGVFVIAGLTLHYVVMKYLLKWDERQACLATAILGIGRPLLSILLAGVLVSHG